VRAFSFSSLTHTAFFHPISPQPRRREHNWPLWWYASFAFLLFPPSRTPSRRRVPSVFFMLEVRFWLASAVMCPFLPPQYLPSSRENPPHPAVDERLPQSGSSAKSSGVPPLNIETLAPTVPSNPRALDRTKTKAPTSRTRKPIPAQNSGHLPLPKVTSLSSSHAPGAICHVRFI